jgi:hypothetical protein
MADIATDIKDWSTTEGSNAPSGSTTIGTGLDDNLRRIQATVRTEYNKHVVTQIPCGRLTLTTATPVTTGDVTAAETLYYTPFKGNTIALFDGTNWRQYTFTERSIDVPDATGVQDVFIYDNAGTLTLELTAWTNDTTRATALTTQDGILVKTGALTRRYLGTFYATTAGNGQVEDSLAKRNVWNYYHRVVRPMKVVEATNTWEYSTGSFQQANASAANQLEYVQGVSEDSVSALVVGQALNSTSNARGVSVGIGVDSTTVSSALLHHRATVTDTLIDNTTAFYKGFPGVGRHLLVWLEKGGGADTQTWHGDNSASGYEQTGIIGEVLA